MRGKTRGYQAYLGAMCVEGGMWQVTYVGLVQGDRWPVRRRVDPLYSDY